MIEFRDSSDVVIGVVTTRGKVLLSTPTVESVVASWLRAGGAVSAFESAYDGWTNGYVTGTRVTNDQAIVSNLSEVRVPKVAPK